MNNVLLNIIRLNSAKINNAGVIRLKNTGGGGGSPDVPVVPEGYSLFMAADGNFFLADGSVFCVKNREYDFVEYLQSNGSQVIDTGYVLNETDEITLNYSNLLAVEKDSFMFGTKDESSGTSIGTWISVYGSTAKIYARFGHSGSANSNINLQNSNQLVMKKGLLSTPTESLTLGYLRMPTYSFAVFGRKDGENVYNPLGAKYRLTSLLITEGDVTKMYLRPAVRKSDGKAGLLDVVSKTFFTNVSNGEDFVIGNIIDF